MKKTMISTLLIATALIGAQMAHAYEVTGLVIAIPLEAGIAVTALVVAPTASTAAAADGDDKQAYFSSLRDEAAQQVADGGVASAELANAIQQIREQTGTSASDRDLSMAIVKANNSRLFAGFADRE
jgi:hypothetical protein